MLEARATANRRDIRTTTKRLQIETQAMRLASALSRGKSGYMGERELESEVGSNLHTPPEVDNAANLAGVCKINKCRAGTRWVRQVYHG